MKTYQKTGTHLYCGHWNGSPVEIGLTELLREVPIGETDHCHDYHEYYVVLRGRGKLVVEGSEVALEPGTIVMVEPGERHRVTEVDHETGVQWVIVKERSVPGSKHCVPDKHGVIRD